MVCFQYSLLPFIELFFLDSSAIPPFLENNGHYSLLSIAQRFDRPALQYQVTDILISLTSESKQATEEIVRIGFIPLLLKLLLSNYIQLVEQSVWVLGFVLVLQVPFYLTSLIVILLFIQKKHYSQQQFCYGIPTKPRYSLGLQSILFSIFI